MEPLKERAITAAHRYSVIVSVFDSAADFPHIATVILLRAPRGRPVLVTSYHVLERFIALGPSGRLQIGANRFTLQGIPPDDILISRRHDLAALALDADDLSKIGKEMLPAEQIASKHVEEGQLVAFVGFPGYWKELRKDREVGLGFYEFFGPVRTVEANQFSILVEPSYDFAITTTRTASSVALTRDLGGLSGAPIFSAEETPQLVGWVYEGQWYSPKDHKLFAIHADAMLSQGSWNIG